MLFLLLLICSSLYAFGQEQKIKLLQQQLMHHPQADTFRVNRLNELGMITSLPSGKVDTLATEALAISRKLGYSEGEGYALINQGQALFNEGHRDKALALVNQALAIAQRAADQRLLVYYYLIMGQLNVQVNNKQALAYELKADSIAEKLPANELTARLQRSIYGIYATSLSDYPKAMEWILKSIKTAEDVHSLNELATSWSNLASMYTSIGDHKNALIYYKKALEANKTLGNKTLSSNLYNSIGERYRLLGNYPEAIKAYNQQLAFSNKSPYLIELCESNLADVYVRIGNLPVAFKYAFHSLQLAEKIDDTEGIAWIDGILGRAYVKFNKPDSAVYYGTRGLDSARKTGTIEFMRDNCGVLANAYAQKKDFANAYKHHGLYISYRDSMINSEVTNQASLMQYNYDLAKKQTQITALNEQKNFRPPYWQAHRPF